MTRGFFWETVRKLGMTVYDFSISFIVPEVRAQWGLWVVRTPIFYALFAFGLHHNVELVFYEFQRPPFLGVR